MIAYTSASSALETAIATDVQFDGVFHPILTIESIKFIKQQSDMSPRHCIFTVYFR